MYHILMCDDNPYILKKFEQSVRSFFTDRHLEYQLNTYQKPRDLLNQASALNHPFIAILDIVMPESNGLQVATDLKAQHCEFVLLFLTSSEEYYYDSCVLQPLHYLSKTNISDAELVSCLDDAIKKIDRLNQTNTTYLPFLSEKHYLLKDLLYCKIADSSICFCFKDGQRFNEPYKEEIMTYFQDSALYQSDNILLNLENITGIQAETITMGSVSLSFSEEEMKKIKLAYAKHMMR